MRVRADAISMHQIPLVDMDELEGFVHGLWQDVTNFEDSEEVPRLKVDTPMVDFGCVRSGDVDPFSMSRGSDRTPGTSSDSLARCA